MATSPVDLYLVSKRRMVQKSRPLQSVGHTMMGGQAAVGALNALTGNQVLQLALPGAFTWAPTAH